MEWIREPMEVNMPKSVSWCPCMGAKCRGNNPPFCSIKTSNCKSVQTECLKQALQKAEAVIIGAGAGLSTSAGFTYSGERFEKWFGDFRQVHGFSDMYSGGFFPYKTLEEYWAYWSRYIGSSTPNILPMFYKGKSPRNTYPKIHAPVGNRQTTFQNVPRNR